MAGLVWKYMGDQQPHAPYKTLGNHLKYLREQSNQSVLEVSGAVEIDMALLDRIESGQERPAEDVLLLLISHFNMSDQEATQLWELAGYEGEGPTKNRIAEELQNKQVVMMLALDMRTIYSDGLDININPGGVTLSFTQAVGQPQSMPVARVGMSYDQAENVVKAMQQALLQAKYLRGPKRLPPTSL